MSYEGKVLAELLAIRLNTEAIKLGSEKLIETLSELNKNLVKEHKQIYHLKECGDLIPVPNESLKHYCQMNMLPYKKLGKHILFHRDILLEWFKEDYKPDISIPLERKTKVKENKQTIPKSTGSGKVSSDTNRVKDNIQAYGKHLESYEWDFFGVLTTTYPLTLKYAYSLIERFHAMLSLKYKVSCFWVAEKFERSDFYHLHCLLKFHEAFPKKDITSVTRAIWQKAAGNPKMKDWNENEALQKVENGGEIKGGDKSGKKFHRVKLELYDKNEHGCFYLAIKLKKENVEYGYMGLEHFTSDGSDKNRN